MILYYYFRFFFFFRISLLTWINGIMTDVIAIAPSHNIQYYISLYRCRKNVNNSEVPLFNNKNNNKSPQIIMRSFFIQLEAWKCRLWCSFSYNFFGNTRNCWNERKASVWWKFMYKERQGERLGGFDFSGALPRSLICGLIWISFLRLVECVYVLEVYLSVVVASLWFMRIKCQRKWNTDSEIERQTERGRASMMPLHSSHNQNAYNNSNNSVISMNSKQFFLFP